MIPGFFFPFSIIATVIPFILRFSTFLPVSLHPQPHPSYSSLSHSGSHISSPFPSLSSLISTLITRIPLIPVLILRIPPPTPRIPLILTLIPGIPTLFHPLPPFRLLQIAKNIGE